MTKERVEMSNKRETSFMNATLWANLLQKIFTISKIENSKLRNKCNWSLCTFALCRYVAYGWKRPFSGVHFQWSQQQIVQQLSERFIANKDIQETSNPLLSSLGLFSIHFALGKFNGWFTDQWTQRNGKILQSMSLRSFFTRTRLCRKLIFPLSPQQRAWLSPKHTRTKAAFFGWKRCSIFFPFLILYQFLYLLFVPVKWEGGHTSPQEFSFYLGIGRRRDTLSDRPGQRECSNHLGMVLMDLRSVLMNEGIFANWVCSYNRFEIKGQN